MSDSFNNLTILKEVGSERINGKSYNMVLCKCKCGNIIKKPKTRVVNGYIKSCGCIKTNKVSILGNEFGMWTVIKEINNDRKGRWFLCKCDCGAEKIVPYTNLLSGKSSSCGCVPKNYKIKYNKNIPNRERLLNIYRGMKSRCYNPKNSSYKDYGQRGIIICDEWLDKTVGFENFAKWANENNYSDELSIDRIDVNGNYEPNNCKWSTPSEQSKNKRNNKYLTYKGKTMTITDWAKEIGCAWNTIYYRMLRGLDIEEILAKPKH